jgi:hypothetical protein
MRQKRMTGRKCYDHLGSNLGAALLDFYVSNGWIELEDGTNYRNGAGFKESHPNY